MLKTLLFFAVAGGLLGQTEPTVLASLRYIDLTVGSGEPAAPGKRFVVHYTGWLKDGTKFDSSVDRNEPFEFVQGRRDVIVGWDIGFEGMKVGGKRKLFIPYQLAYGENGRGPIPPKAELIFDVELLGVKDAPATPAAIDVLTPLIELETNLTALARPLTEDQFAAVARYFIRSATLNESMLESAEKDDPGITELKPDGAMPGKDMAGKDAVLARLSESFAAVRKRLDSARAGYLNGDATLFGKPTTRRGLFVALDEAIGEQYGHALAVLKK